MRLTDHEHSAIVAVLKRHFGDDAVIWLFGSRVELPLTPSFSGLPAAC